MDDEDLGGPDAGQAWPSPERTWLAEVERTWKGLAPPGALPRRRDLDASSLGPALVQAFTLEEVAPGTARLRVAGQRLHEWFGADPRGVPLSALFEAGSRPRLREALLASFGRPAVVELGVAMPRGAFRPAIGGRLLLLPLQNDDATVTRAIGVIGMDLASPAGPRRLALVEAGPIRVDPVLVRLDRAERARAAPPLRPVPGLAEPARPWLRLVVSND